MLNLFDEPERDIDNTAVRYVTCDECRGRGVRLRSTSYQKQGRSRVCSECRGDGVIVHDPNKDTTT